VATGGMSIGHKGMMLAAKALAATMVDLYEDPEAIEAITAEFREKKGATEFEAYVLEGPPPIPE
jgi:aminobenzoyl-glutamate utilization protein B